MRICYRYSRRQPSCVIRVAFCLSASDILVTTQPRLAVSSILTTRQWCNFVTLAATIPHLEVSFRLIMQPNWNGTHLLHIVPALSLAVSFLCWPTFVKRRPLRFHRLKRIRPFVPHGCLFSVDIHHLSGYSTEIRDFNGITRSGFLFRLGAQQFPPSDIFSTLIYRITFRRQGKFIAWHSLASGILDFSQPGDVSSGTLMRHRIRRIFWNIALSILIFLRGHCFRNIHRTLVYLIMIGLLMCNWVGLSPGALLVCRSAPFPILRFHCA